MRPGERNNLIVRHALRSLRDAARARKEKPYLILPHLFPCDDGQEEKEY
jgi:hypothetical protein